MKVFITWSGASSKAVAEALRTWLPDVLQDLDCFMSAHDIQAGERWAELLGRELEASDFGILCLTPENPSAECVLF